MTEQDQAQKLRELVRQVGRQRDAESHSPAIVAIVGCCAGVGTTTIVNRLAAVLANQSIQVEIRTNEALSDNAQIDVDIVLIDGGAGCSQESASGWNRTDLVLLVVTSDREALLETYGALKMAKLDNPDLPIYLLPNRCCDEREAQMIHQRITQSCERFLGFAVPAAPWLPKFNISEAQDELQPNALNLARYVSERMLIAVERRNWVA